VSGSYRISQLEALALRIEVLNTNKIAELRLNPTIVRRYLALFSYLPLYVVIPFNVERSGCPFHDHTGQPFPSLPEAQPGRPQGSIICYPQGRVGIYASWVGGTLQGAKGTRICC
jgi:hypothetical protein